MTKHSILTICVNYKNPLETESFLQKLFWLNGYANEVALVVDNDEISPGLDLSKLWKISSNIIVKSPGENLGYFRGANFGLSEYLKEHELPDWVIVSNTDIEFPDKDIFAKLKNYPAPNVAVIAPDIELVTNSWLPSSSKHQNPCMRLRPSAIRMHALKWICSSYYGLLMYQTASSLRYVLFDLLNGLTKTNGMDVKKEPVEIYAPFGAHLIFPKTYFINGGTLQHGAFLFGEEIFVAETSRRLNLKVIFDPRLKVIHREHSSLRKIGSRYAARYAREATRYLADTFFNGT
jgi:GT2 family glycosyltransferase